MWEVHSDVVDTVVPGYVLSKSDRACGCVGGWVVGIRFRPDLLSATPLDGCACEAAFCSNTVTVVDDDT